MSFTFYSIGDWGVLNPGLISTAKSMDLLSNKYKPNCILSLGDNFYPNGVSDVDDPLWDTVYKKIFTGKYLYCPWYCILGNHDYKKSPQAQIDYYLQKKDKRWTMPSNYYTVIKTIDDYSIQFVFIDTVQLDLYSAPGLFTIEELKKIKLSQSKSDAQLIWIEDVLEKSTADWLIVVGHYNLYSGGYHGSNRNLINMLKQIFIKNKVDMYICGHCHNLEHISNSGIEYIISGSAAKKGDVTQIYNGNFSYSSNGYTIHQVTKNKLTTFFICSETSEILYSFDINK